MGQSTSLSGVASLPTRKGQLTSLQIVPVNAIGNGQPSSAIQLTPAALPSASQSITVTEYGLNYLAL